MLTLTQIALVLLKLNGQLNYSWVIILLPLEAVLLEIIVLSIDLLFNYIMVIKTAYRLNKKKLELYRRNKWN